MRIALDGLPLCQPLTGIGHYTLELAHALAQNEKADKVAVLSPRAFHSSARKNEQLNGPSLVHATLNPIIRSWWRSGLLSYLRKNEFDVFHGTNYDLPLGVSCPTVVTIHDLSTLLYPQTHEKKNVARAQQRLPIIAQTAARIITPTEAVRREVAEHLGVSLEKIVAIAEAARSFFHRVAPQETTLTRQRFDIGDDFLLYVGTVEPRKNLLTLIKAFEQLATDRPNLQLVISGKRGWMVDDLMTYAKRSQASRQIIFTGYLGDVDLRALYSSCRVFIYPSFYEGFGLPPLEAMACGAPVIASDIPSIAEVVGDAAVLLDPKDLNLLAESIEHLLENIDAREVLEQKGFERAAMFSWKRAAQLTRAVYEEVV